MLQGPHPGTSLPSNCLLATRAPEDPPFNPFQAWASDDLSGSSVALVRMARGAQNWASDPCGWRLRSGLTSCPKIAGSSSPASTPSSNPAPGAEPALRPAGPDQVSPCSVAQRQNPLTAHPTWKGLLSIRPCSGSHALVTLPCDLRSVLSCCQLDPGHLPMPVADSDHLLAGSRDHPPWAWLLNK